MSNLKSLKNIIENYSEELKYLSSSEIENLQALLEDIKDRPKNIWDLETKGGETYYRLYGVGDIVRETFNTKYDEGARDIGNAFLTREEAEFERERRKIETIMKKYSRPFDEDKINYFIECNHHSNGKTIGINYYYSTDYGTPCFESKEIGRKVIDEIGEDRLWKYWFGVK